MIADKIKLLRESRGMTQTDVAKKLGVTRSGVNAWEMGISIPSTRYIVELALLFNVSADYLLGLDKSSTLSIEGLTDKECAMVTELINYFKSIKNKN